jgi:hypothetical protein
MLAPVDLDDQAGLDASKVDDERSDRDLAAEVITLESIAAQSVPEPVLGVRHGCSQLTNPIATRALG